MKLTMQSHGDAISAALERGASYRDIAKQLGCSHHTVSVFAKLNFPDLRRKPEVAAAPVERDDGGMQVLIIDIETCPNLAYVWGIWDQNVGTNQIAKATEIISFAAKWLNDPVVHFKSVYHNDYGDMITHAWNLMDKADVIMHYNGKNFDVPHLNREFLSIGLTPPAPFKQIDLLNTVRRQFKFPSNKLAYVSEALGLEGKVEHEGFGLWLKCMDNDEDAWGRMREYNIRDVTLLEELYAKLLPWIERHPSIAAFNSSDVCPNCGGELQRDGYAYTRTGKYQRYECKGCGKYSRATKRSDHTDITEIAA